MSFKLNKYHKTPSPCEDNAAAAGGVSLYLFVWVRAVIAEHQVGSSAVEQQVCRFKGEGEALDALTEV